MRNPFIYGKVVDSGSFCNRVNESKTLNGYINDMYSVWLFAPRRYGKTSLIKQVFSQSKEVKTIYFDLYNVKSLDDFARKYADLLARELFDWRDDIKVVAKRVSSYFKSITAKISFDESANPSLSLLQHDVTSPINIEEVLELPEKIAKERGIKVYIAFDEFQEITRIESFVIHLMRAAYQNQKNVAYAFLGSKQSMMNDIFTSINSPFYEYATKMELKSISREDWITFVKGKFEEGEIEIKNETINSILDFSDCHPHFTQYFSSVVFDVLRSGVKEDSDNFNDYWKSKIINSQSDVFLNIFDQLNANQRNTIVALAHNVEEIYSEEARNKFDLPLSSSLTVSITSLMNRSLVVKYGKQYKVYNPIINEWLKTL